MSGFFSLQVLLRCLTSLLVSEVWTNDDIMAEIAAFKGEIIDHAVDTIKTISLIVYPAIDGCNKLRLAYVYSCSLTATYIWKKPKIHCR